LIESLVDDSGDEKRRVEKNRESCTLFLERLKEIKVKSQLFILVFPVIDSNIDTSHHKNHTLSKVHLSDIGKSGGKT